MARPQKKGIDYFQHDTVLFGKTMSTLEETFGNDGYAFWFKLLELLGNEECLFYDCNKKSNWLFLVTRAKISEQKAEEIMTLLSDLEAIDYELWNKKRIIWCQNFVDRVSDVFKKRKTETPNKPCFCDGNDSTTALKVAESTQSKVKESKVNKKESIKKKNTHTFDLYISNSSLDKKLKDKLNDWLEYKRQRNESFVERGFKALISELQNNQNKHGAEAVIDLIDSCMAAGWKGIIFEKLNESKPLKASPPKNKPFNDKQYSDAELNKLYNDPEQDRM